MWIDKHRQKCEAMDNAATERLAALLAQKQGISAQLRAPLKPAAPHWYKNRRKVVDSQREQRRLAFNMALEQPQKALQQHIKRGRKKQVA